jgi:hypothetical protein
VSGQMSRGPRWAVIATGLCCLILASSCGGPKIPEIQGKLPVFPVKGSVQMDGKPLSQAELTFYPVQPLPSGASKILPRARTQDDGTFSVTTYSDGDGAPEGSYRVTVTWRGTGTGEDEERRTDDDPNLVPPMYHNPRITKLRAKVEEGENTLPAFEINMVQQQASNGTGP